jgi:alpha-tubulin suppressor-like RCC1 family protein
VGKIGVFRSLLLGLFCAVLAIPASLTAVEFSPAIANTSDQVNEYTPLTPARLLDTRAGATTIDGRFAGRGALREGEIFNVQILGRGGVPATGVSAVALNVTVVNPTRDSHLTVFPKGEALPNASNLNFTPGKTVPNMVIAKIGADGSISVRNAFGSADVIIDIAGWYAAVGAYSALTPARLLDTRAGASTIDGRFAGVGALKQGEIFNLPIIGRGGVPSTGVSAVALNVTVVNPTSDSHLTVFPKGEVLPNASNLNFTPGQTVPNMVIAKIGADGSISIRNAIGLTNVVIDVAGWFTSGGAYSAITPARLMDSRPGTSTIDGLSRSSGQILARQTYHLRVLGRGGVPSTGVSAVALNVTVVNPTADSHLTVFPKGEAVPNASNLNFVPGQTVPNMVVAKVGADGSISIQNAIGAVYVIVDIAGWYANAQIPVVFSNPRVLGSGQSGTNLSVDPGTWTGFPAPSLSYQWYACESLIPTSLSTKPDPQQMGDCQQLGTAIKISAGNSESCAILSDGRVQCWGSLTFGEFGPSYRPRYTPEDIEGISTAIAVSSGNAHSCALLSDGSVRCWGSNSSGRLGNNSRTGSFTPVIVQGVSNATSISVGADSSCAVLTDQSVKCWGANDNGELGNNSREDSAVPVTVAGVSDAQSVSVGSSHACVVTFGGQVKCWGYNGEGALGNNSRINSLSPVLVSEISSATSISAGTSHTCALLSSGSIKCWGSNSQGQIGNNSRVSSLVPTEVTNISTATSISSGTYHNCAVLMGGQVKCWGYNGSGRLGNSSDIDSLVPVAVFGLSTATSISVADQHSCAVTTDGRVLCWGLASAIGRDSGKGDSFVPIGLSGFISGTNSYISLNPLLAQRHIIVRVRATNLLGSSERFSSSVQVFE